MIAIVLFIIIGLKLNILNSWYLGLIIIYGIIRLYQLCVEFYKLGKKVSER